MTETADETLKKRGRPPTFSTETAVRIAPDMIAFLDRWRETQTDRPSRAEAIRRIIWMFRKSMENGK